MQSEGNELAQAARGGDRSAAEGLIRMFYSRVYAFLRRRVATDEDAADLCQRTFERVWQALPTFAGRSSVNCWVHGIAYHVYVDWRRRLKPHEYRTDEWWEKQESFAPGPERAAVEQDLRELLFAGVNKLDEELCSTVHLHFFQELSLRETAEALGVAESTVKYRLRSAISILQRKLAEERPVSTESKL